MATAYESENGEALPGMFVIVDFLLGESNAPAPGGSPGTWRRTSGRRWACADGRRGWSDAPLPCGAPACG